MRIQYKTNLSIDECRDIIKNIKKYSFDNSKFRGSIIGKYFKIRVAFYFTNLFIPAFYGKLIEKNNTTYIEGRILFINPMGYVINIIFLGLFLIYIIIYIILYKFNLLILFSIIAMIFIIIVGYILVRNHPEKINSFIKEIFKVVE